MNDWAEGQECGEGRGGKNFRSSLALASSGPSKNEPVSGKPELGKLVQSEVLGESLGPGTEITEAL